jgi:hypothetical protein
MLAAIFKRSANIVPMCCLCIADSRVEFSGGTPLSSKNFSVYLLIWRNDYGEIIGKRLLIEEIKKFIKIL